MPPGRSDAAHALTMTGGSGGYRDADAQHHQTAGGCHTGQRDLDAVLDKEWESKSLKALLKAPVSALSGISEQTPRRCGRPSTSRRWGDLGRNKYFRAAQALTLLAESTGKK